MTDTLFERDQILASVRFAAQQFLASADWRPVINGVLAKIGQAAAVSRVYVFENHAGPEHTELSSQRYEWVSAGIKPQFDHSQFKGSSWRRLISEATADRLQRGEIVAGLVRQLSPTERALPESQGIQALVFVPISVEGAWWGFLGLDECARERQWTEAELGSLRAAADILGAAIARRRAQDALLETKATLEQRVIERTRELEEQVAATRRSEAEKEMILAAAQIGIMIVERDSHRILYLNATAQKMAGRTQEALLGKCCHVAVCPAQRGRCPVTDLRQTVDQSERVLVDGQGRHIPILKSVAPITFHGQSGLIECFIDLTERKRAEQVVENLHKELVVASRQAGMAEVAAGVLHNVGNVLNSVSVAANLMSDRLRQSRVANLRRATCMLRDQNGHLAEFLTTDPKGKLLPEYLGAVADQLAAEQTELITEMKAMGEHIEHLKEIVAMQQCYAKVSGNYENVAPAGLVEDALRLNAAAFERHRIEVVREFDEQTPTVCVDRHKVLQILINLLSNAKHAMDGPETLDKRLVVRVGPVSPGQVKIAVCDQGTGIAPENLVKIFSHGFTTKKDGHGFGLHSGANAAKELGGSLTAHSDGVGRGATFTLELPVATSVR